MCEPHSRKTWLIFKFLVLVDESEYISHRSTLSSATCKYSNLIVQISGLTCKHNAKIESWPDDCYPEADSQGSAGPPKPKLKGLSDKGIDPMYPKRPHTKNNRPPQYMSV